MAFALRTLFVGCGLVAENINRFFCQIGRLALTAATALASACAGERALREAAKRYRRGRRVGLRASLFIKLRSERLRAPNR